MTRVISSMCRTGSRPPVLPEEPFPTQPDAVVILVDKLAAWTDLPTTAALALATFSRPAACMLHIDRNVQIIQYLDELPVRKALDQGHTASKAETAPHLRGGPFSYQLPYCDVGLARSRCDAICG
jgi:hypothetical protein